MFCCMNRQGSIEMSKTAIKTSTSICNLHLDPTDLRMVEQALRAAEALEELIKHPVSPFNSRASRELKLEVLRRNHRRIWRRLMKEPMADMSWELEVLMTALAPRKR